jgi:hypothetical protein
MTQLFIAVTLICILILLILMLIAMIWSNRD